MFCASFGQDQRTIRKIKSGQALASAKLRPSLLPVQPPGDHQVQHQPEIAFHSNGNSFTDVPQLADGSTHRLFDGWFRGAEQEGARQPYFVDQLAYDPRVQRADVGSNVW